MLEIHRSKISCGVRQIRNLGDLSPRDIVLHCRQQYKATYQGAYFLFSDNTMLGENGNGYKLADFISQRDFLGDVYEVGPQYNPSSGHEIMLWIWEVNQQWMNSNKRLK